MNRSRPLQIAFVLATGAILYLISPLDMGPTLFVVVQVCGALLGAVIFKKRPKTGAAIGFLGPLLIFILFAAILIWILLHTRLPT